MWRYARQASQLCLSDPLESGRRERPGLDEPAHPAEAAVRIGLVVVVPDRGEDPSVAEIPLLDLVVTAFGIGAEALQIRAEPFLHPREPRLTRIAIRIDPAEL